MVCRGEVKLIVPAWLADGWVGADMWLLFFPLPSGADGVRGWRREVRNQLWARRGGKQAQVRPPLGISVVIDWSCLMHWDQLSGHRCGNPTPQTLRAVFILRARSDAVLAFDCRKAH